ncbi:unnamed protein product [Fusarium venenatum]|uniref:Uncharacterized protein n=1 Tax=Fusarium venenatum TaxID=56646 RepID=A0A2L2SVW1_9HYPO|nr:uncharacterized protein FVRRES_06230 [Fusarium venenatum]CEI61794.1 unnamed protein product [Fusarium venenatum]
MQRLTSRAQVSGHGLETIDLSSPRTEQATQRNNDKRPTSDTDQVFVPAQGDLTEDNNEVMVESLPLHA